MAKKLHLINKRDKAKMIARGYKIVPEGTPLGELATDGLLTVVNRMGPDGEPRFVTCRRGDKVYRRALANPDKYRISYDMGESFDLSDPETAKKVTVLVTDGSKLMKAPRRDPKCCLADMLLDPRTMSPAVKFDLSEDRALVRKAKRIVFDESGSRMMSRLALQWPPKIEEVIPNAEPPAPITWIEYPTLAYQREAEKLAEGASEHWRVPKALTPTDQIGENERGGWLIVREGQVLTIRSFGHIDDGRLTALPVYHVVALEGAPFVNRAAEGEVLTDFGGGAIIGGKNSPKPLIFQTGISWGLEGAADSVLKPLVGRARLVTRIDMIGNIPAAEFNQLARLAGSALPMAIFCLAMLNSVASITTEERPTGARLIVGSSRPYLTRSTAYVTVPKRIRNVAAWARREMVEAARRKALHEVAAHYRHLSWKPRREGWTEVQVDGRTYWRKRIDSHLRGDPDVGVVEHTHTVVRA